MAHTKSQLPMIRSLKTIARRKMNMEYWNVDVTPAQEAQFKKDGATQKKLYTTALRRFMRGQNRVTLLGLAMCELRQACTAEESAAVAAFQKNMEDMAKDYKVCGNNPKAAYQQGVVSTAKKIFNELEGLELKIISGEEVDLAPYARQLQS